jgi:three-Cys-motif partner protein
MAHKFGGEWTDDKLEVMRRYFSAYAMALKNQAFGRWYVDAFAGTGERTDRQISDGETPGQVSLFADDAPEVVETKDGSVRIALGIEPPFDRYVFIDRSAQHASALAALSGEYPERTIDIRRGDANDILVTIARSTDWRRTRAAVFIDPYGMQVDWMTLEALARTKAVDIALLFPTGPLNRMLTRDGRIPPEWERRIDAHLGPCDWRSASYREIQSDDLFDVRASSIEKRMTADGLRRFVLERLQTAFPYVCESQLELRNSREAVLYHLFIICANPADKAVQLAKRLARSAVKPRRGTR